MSAAKSKKIEPVPYGCERERRGESCPFCDERARARTLRVKGYGVAGVTP